MERNGPSGRVTNSGTVGPATALQPGHDHEAGDQAGDQADRHGRAEVRARAALRLLNERVAVRVDERGDDRAAERAEHGAAEHDEQQHGASLTGLAGDVDPSGDVVDELMERLRVGWPDSPIHPEWQADLVASLLRGRGIR